MQYNIEKRLILNQMRWAGRVLRMGDGKIPKQLFYGELTRWKRQQHKPRKRFKDFLKSNLKELEIDVDNSREALTENRASWRKLIRERCSNLERKLVEHAALKHALRMQDYSAVPTNVLYELKCSVCGRFFLSKAGMVNYLKSHGQRPNEAVYEETLPARPIKHTCSTCGLVCMSACGLTIGTLIYTKMFLSR